MPNLIQKTSRPNTWMGREGVSTVFARSETAIRSGERVSAIRWTDTGEVTVSHIEGDGRYAGFQRFDERTLPAGATDSDVLAYAQSRLG